MRIYMISTDGLEVLKENVQINLPLYRGDGMFSDLKLVMPNYVDIEGNFDGLDIEGGPKSDAKNALIIFNALKKISPELARREELWVSLTHGELFEYSRTRWKVPKNDDDAAQRAVEAHFFANDLRDIESRNAVSRLFWGAHLASRVKKYAIEDVLATLFNLTDFRQNFVERPSIIQSPTLFTAVIGQMMASMKDDGILVSRYPTREFLIEVNHLFGNLAIEFLSQQKVDSLVAKVADEVRERYAVAETC